jgi:hypothetical protein
MCGTSITVGPTAEFLSGLAVWQLIRWQNIEAGKEDKLDHETLFFLRPAMFMTRQFD